MFIATSKICAIHFSIIIIINTVVALSIAYFCSTFTSSIGGVNLLNFGFGERAIVDGKFVNETVEVMLAGWIIHAKIPNSITTGPVNIPSKSQIIYISF